MCRNIRILRRPEGPPTDDELHDAALQFVRKISGYRVPSRANEIAFERAVREVAMAGRRLFDDLEIRPGPARPAPARTRA
jgi:hypothetical protein